MPVMMCDPKEKVSAQKKYTKFVTKRHDNEQNTDDNEISVSEEDDSEKASDVGIDDDVMLSASDEEVETDDDTIHSSGVKHKQKGLANVMSLILNKKTKDKVILSKSKTDKEIAKQKLNKRKTKDDTVESKEDGTVTFLKHKYSKTDIDSDNNEISNEERDLQQEREKRIKKKAWEEMGRVKPNVLHKDKEKNLQRIATKGVVQLFNAVKKQQKMVTEMVEDVGPSERKKDKVLQSISKGQFLDMLKGTSNNVVVDDEINGNKKEKRNSAASKVKSTEVISKEKPAWSILRDDFMMGAKMKDWDKESDDEHELSNNSDDSDDMDAT